MGGARNSFIFPEPLYSAPPPVQIRVGAQGIRGFVFFFFFNLKNVFLNDHTVKLAVFLLAHSCLNFHMCRNSVNTTTIRI